jgi:hypothetical protein
VSTNGHDSNPGTLAAPFRTIQWAASLMEPGDTCHIRGGMYRETVTPANSGTSNAPITFKAYNGERVTINGTDVVRGWTRHSNHVYRTVIPWDLGLGKNQVFMDGRMISEARYPNQRFDPTNGLDVSRPPRASIVDVFADELFFFVADPNLPIGPWGDARINITDQTWGLMETMTVLGAADQQLFLRRIGLGYGDPQIDAQYFLWGKLELLDAPAEWFLERTSLYLWTPWSDDPERHVVEVKHRPLGFALTNRAYITIEGLHLFACTISSVSPSNTAHHLVLDGIHARYVSHELDLSGFDPWTDGLSTSGVLLHGHDHVIRNSSIAFSSGNGLALQGSNCVAVNNIIHDVNYAGTDCAAVAVASDWKSYGPSVGHELAYNTCFNGGRSLVLHRRCGRLKIHHNHLFNAGLQTGDGGVTYCFDTDGEGTEIAYNVVHNNYGYYYNAGIYLDNYSFHFVVHHNLVFNCGVALNLNQPSRGNKIYHNTFLGFTYGATGIFDGGMAGTELRNNIFTRYYCPIPEGISENNLGMPVDPVFVNPNAFDFRLQTHSPAREVGLLLPPYTDGAQGWPDLGAYESDLPLWNAGATIQEPRVYGDLEPPSWPPSTGLVGAFYDYANWTMFHGLRCDPTIDFDLAPGVPTVGLYGTVGWAGRWRGFVVAPVSGLYTFTIESDYPATLTLGNQAVAATSRAGTNSGSLTLAAGQGYALNFELFKTEGAGHVRLKWSYPGQPSQVIPPGALRPPPSPLGNRRAGTPGVQLPPEVALVAPTNGARYVVGSTVTLRALTYDPDGATNRVEFFVDARSLGAVAALDYGAVVWSNAPLGTYALKAVVTDADGLVRTSRVVTVSILDGSARPVTLVPEGAVWNYLDTGVDLGTNWFAPGFDDRAWPSGPAPLGYGKSNEATRINFGPNPNNKRITTYFRHRFEARNAALFTNLTLRVQRDDGALAYLNGEEVFFSNMPRVKPAARTLAWSPAEGFDETNFFSAQVPVGLLREGANVMAVEVHQASTNTPDCVFNLELSGTQVWFGPVLDQVREHPVLVVTGPPAAQVEVGDVPPRRTAWTVGNTVLTNATHSSLQLILTPTDKPGQYAVGLAGLSPSGGSPLASLGAAHLPTLNSQWVPGVGTTLSFTGQAKARYWILSSTNQTTWQVVTNLPGREGAMEFLDPDSSAAPRKAYRLQVEPQ